MLCSLITLPCQSVQKLIYMLVELQEIRQSAWDSIRVALSNHIRQFQQSLPRVSIGGGNDLNGNIDISLVQTSSSACFQCSTAGPLLGLAFEVTLQKLGLWLLPIDKSIVTIVSAISKIDHISSCSLSAAKENRPLAHAAVHASSRLRVLLKISSRIRRLLASDFAWTVSKLGVKTQRAAEWLASKPHVASRRKWALGARLEA